MRNNKDFDFIKSRFDNDNLTAPDIFDESNITNIIDGKEQKRIKLTQKRSFKTALSLVACFVLIFTAVTAVTTISRTPRLVEPEITEIEKPSGNQQLNEEPEIDGLRTFKSYGEIKSTLKEIEKASVIEGVTHPFATIFGYGVDSDIKGDASAMETSDASNSTGSNVSFGETYKQVENVDEADIIKNNGKYIFWLDASVDDIAIFEGKKLVTKIKDFHRPEWEEYNNGDYAVTDGINDDNRYTTVEDMFLVGDKLIVNCAIDELTKTKLNNGTSEYFNSLTAVYIYDISNIKAPKLLHHFEQTGLFVDSRMVGNTLYLISNHLDRNQNILYPYTCVDESKSCYLPYSDIYCPEAPNSKSYLVASAIDIENFEQSNVNSKAFLGYADKLYCTDHSMYITIWGDETEIFKAELKDNNIKFTATGKVKGSINDQFSMDEKDGYFRIATTYYDSKTEKEKNCLYVLDEKLKQVGKTSGFAKGESIKAVKYIGDMAYVITYEQTDPLFVIDLSNPKAPEIKGSVKITGFSSLLTPVDENTLLGIGYATDDGIEEGTEVVDGLKLALFDISNPEKPRVLDSYSIQDAYSEAQHNHHALVVNKDMNYFAIPFNLEHYEEVGKPRIESGALLVRVDDGKLVVCKDFIEKRTDYSYSTRCTYIGDKLYVLEEYMDNIKEYTVSEKNFK